MRGAGLSRAWHTRSAFAVGSGTFAYRRALITGNLLDSDYVVSANGGTTQTLPAAAGRVGKVIGVKRFPGTVGNVTVNVSGGGLLENTASNFVLTQTLSTLVFFWISNGTQWEMISK